jgi:hypothetical protein
MSPKFSECASQADPNLREVHTDQSELIDDDNELIDDEHEFDVDELDAD